MNLQALQKQAAALQKDMMKAQSEIESSEFEGSSSFVKVRVTGAKKILEVKIDKNSLEKDDIEMLQDIIVVAINEAFKKVDDFTEEKMGKYTKGIPGLF